jgi:hypothetical protein
MDFPMFPRAHFDKMLSAAQAHNPNDLPKRETLKWHFDAQVGGRFDAAESAFLSRQLEYMREGVLQVQYPAMKGSILVPLETSIDPGAPAYTYQVYNHVGSALICASLPSDPPRVDIGGTESTQQIRSVVCAFGYNIQEARAAAMARRPLLPQRMMAARDIVERTLDDVWFNGNAATGLQGLLNLSGASTYTVALGASASKLWDTKTPDEIVADLNGITNSIVTATKEVYAPDTIVLPLTAYTLITSKRMGIGSDTTIMDHFLKVSPYIKNIFATHKSELSGAGSTRRMVCYRRDPNVLLGLLPQPFEMLAPQAEMYEVVTPCHARTGGVIVFQPLAVAYGDGL